MIYMTADEWFKLEKILRKNDFFGSGYYRFAEEVTDKVDILDMSEEELDEIMKNNALDNMILN